jgi:hypothetical protein
MLIADYPFFSWGGHDWTNPRVKTSPGKSLRHTDTYFTQIETLYNLNKAFLMSAERRNTEMSDEKQFIRVRPEEEYINECYRELTTTWDALLEVLPQLRADPLRMRVHNPSPGSDGADHALFWPIGQEMIARPVRSLLDRAFDPAGLDKETAIRALSPLGRVPWELHEIPWRNLLLVREDEEHEWRMRSEARAEAVKVGVNLLNWIVGIVDHSEDNLERLRAKWEMTLYKPDNNDLDEAWERLLKIKVHATGNML